MAVVGLSVCFLGAIPILADRFGMYFLPSPAWLISSKWIARLCAVATMAIIFNTLYRAQIREYATKRTQIGVLVMLGSPFMSYPAGSHAVQVGFPFVYTVLFGSEGEHIYLVDETDRVRFGKRTCRYPIILRDMPMVSNKLCDLPSDFGSSLHPGMTIAVEGKSSYFGVFPDQARLED